MRNSHTLAIVTTLIALTAFTAVRNTWRSEEHLDACEANLKNIGTAMEMYARDYSGRYAGQLSDLTPQYMAALPTCPAAGFDTYSAGFASEG